MLVCLECVWVEVDLEPREVSKIRSPLWFEGAEVLEKVEQCQAKWDHGIIMGSWWRGFMLSCLTYAKSLIKLQSQGNAMPLEKELTFNPVQILVEGGACLI